MFKRILSVLVLVGVIGVAQAEEPPLVRLNRTRVKITQTIRLAGAKITQNNAEKRLVRSRAKVKSIEREGPGSLYTNRGLAAIDKVKDDEINLKAIQRRRTDLKWDRKNANQTSGPYDRKYYRQAVVHRQEMLDSLTDDESINSIDSGYVSGSETL